MEAAPLGPAPIPKQFVLCFDGTGNKFAGDESDSNVLKIFRVSRYVKQNIYEKGVNTDVDRCWTEAKVTNFTTTNRVLEPM